VRRLLVGQQEQQIDVGKRGQFAAAITADRGDRHLFALGRVGDRIDPLDREVVDDPDQLVDQEGLLGDGPGGGAARLKAAADFVAAAPERRLQGRQQQAAVVRRAVRNGLRQRVGERSPVDDLALPQDVGHRLVPSFPRKRESRGQRLTGCPGPPLSRG
jgi:hypothetical protein